MPGVRLGLGRPVQDVEPSVLVVLWKLILATEFLFLWAIAIIKFSVLSFYWRLFRVSSIKKPIYLVAAVVLAWLISSVGLNPTLSLLSVRILFFETVATAVQCVPARKLWEPTSPGHCFNFATSNFSVAVAIPEVITDFVILVMPVPYIWRLQMKLQQKVLLTIIFVFGGL